MNLPKFNQDSWVGRIADDFTTTTVAIVSKAVGLWMLQEGLKSVMIGFDTRFGGSMFAQKAAAQFATMGLNVTLTDKVITSPILVLNMVKHEVDIGIMFTASNLPAEYNGMKMKGISSQKSMDLINSYIDHDENNASQTKFSDTDIQIMDMEEAYLQYIRAAIDLDLLVKSEKILAFDAMYGATQFAFEKLLPGSMKLRCDFNPMFDHVVPHPNPESLSVLSNVVKGVDFALGGFGVNSDGEILAMCDENGQFFNPYDFLSEEENIPWRDALFISLKIAEKVIQSGRKLSELI
ncbi:phosphohexomutase domain-containing protein [Portibacter marinus]|uniref:hypothetical protein n=1 Tax=Portibacter marinus TaxID=2898660 RepID=UPI001F176690|nr:hypothetical protein [Portibacter marinus]